MWALVVLFSMLSVAGAVAVSQAAREPVLEQALGEDKALNMAVYRAFVVQAVMRQPGLSGTVPDSGLALPVWYRRDPSWNNVVLADGTIVVYASTSASPTLLGDLYTLSGQSALVGEMRPSQNGEVTLYALRAGDTGLAVPGLMTGTVAWLAHAD